MTLDKDTDIFAVVCYSAADASYRLNIFSEESVPLFGPALPTPPIFHDYEEFRDFLLVKCKSSNQTLKRYIVWGNLLSLRYFLGKQDTGRISFKFEITIKNEF